MRLVNLTPHDITLVGAWGTLVVPHEAAPARVAAKSVPAGTVALDGGASIPVTSTDFGAVEGLPQPTDEVVYLVSRIVKDRVPGRNDVMVPADMVRDAGGRIVGCRGLSL